jgi:hypothetical protein
MLAHSDPAASRRLLEQAQEDAVARWRIYERLAAGLGAAGGHVGGGAVAGEQP